MENKKTYTFFFEVLEGCDCMGVPYDEECDCEMELTDAEVGQIKQLIANYNGDLKLGLMPIIKDAMPELYQRIDEEARKAMTLFFWLGVVHSGSDGIDTNYDEELFRANYQRDVESGDFVPSEDFEPEDEDEYDEDEDMEYIEWYERERDRMTYEDADWFRERYNEDFSGVDVSYDEYICYIPEEFMPE